MRLLFPICTLYLLIVTTYIFSTKDSLLKSVQKEYKDSYQERLKTEIDSVRDSGKCLIANDESSGVESSEDKCLTTKKVKDIKTALLDEQPVYPLNPGILNTTLNICNPRRGSCF